MKSYFLPFTGSGQRLRFAFGDITLIVSLEAARTLKASWHFLLPDSSESTLLAYSLHCLCLQHGWLPPPWSAGISSFTLSNACLLNLREKASSSFSLVSCSWCKMGRAVVLGRIRLSRKWRPCLKLHDPSAWGILFSFSRLQCFGALLYLFSVHILGFDLICLTERLKRYPPNQTTICHSGRWF